MNRRNAAPIFLLAGGPGSPRGAYGDVLASAFVLSGKKKPLVAYIGAATDDNRAFFWFMRRFIKRGGPCEIELAPLGGRRRRDFSAAREVLERADLVFLGGGDVELGMKRLREAEIIPLLQKKYEEGTPFAGISAGSIMLCRQWVRWPESGEGAELFDCLGFAQVYCDTHGEDDGWEELHALLRLLGGDAVGYGIRSGAALRVATNGEVMTVAGEVDKLRSDAESTKKRSHR